MWMIVFIFVFKVKIGMCLFKDVNLIVSQYLFNDEFLRTSC